LSPEAKQNQFSIVSASRIERNRWKRCNQQMINAIMHTWLIVHGLSGYPFSAWPLLSCSQEAAGWHTPEN